MTTATLEAKTEHVEKTTGEGGIKNSILGISEVIRKSMVIDTATGHAVVDKDVFERTLPEGLTMDNVTQTFDHFRDVAIAGAHAAGKTSLDILKENKDLPHITVTMPVVGKTKLDYTVNKQGTMTTANGPIDYFGSIRTSAVIAGIDGAEMKRVKSLVSELHKEALANLGK